MPYFSLFTLSPDKPKNPIINHHPSQYSWEEDGLSLFSPLFQSFTPAINEALISGYFSFLNIPEELEKAEERGYEREEYLADLSLQIQAAAKTIYFLDSETGEVLFELELTPENLNKSLEEVVPGDLLPAVSGDELQNIYFSF